MLIKNLTIKKHFHINIFLCQNCNTIRLRFWQLVSATVKCCQNPVLPKPDNEAKITENSKTIFMG